MKRADWTQLVTGLWWVCIICLVATLPAQAQNGSCKMLCPPEIKIEPTVTFEKFAGQPNVVTYENGKPPDTATVSPEQAFEMIFALDIPPPFPG